MRAPPPRSHSAIGPLCSHAATMPAAKSAPTVAFTAPDIGSEKPSSHDT